MVREQTGSANQFLETTSLQEGNPKETGRLGVSSANPPEVPLVGSGSKEEAWDHKHKDPMCCVVTATLHKI